MADFKSIGADLQRQFEDLASRAMASDQGQRVLGWYDQLGSRDRLALRALGSFVGAVLAYALLIAPMIDYGNGAQRRLTDERELLSWLRSHQGEVQGAGSQSGEGRNQPLATLVNTTAQEHKLTIRRYEPAGEDGIKIWMDGAPFKALVKWLYQLEGGHGVRAQDFTLEPGAAPGTVSARLTLQG